MKPSEIIATKTIHLERLSAQRGAAGEVALIDEMDEWVPRPKGRPLKILLGELTKIGISIKWSSFDAICLPRRVDFSNPDEVRSQINDMVFIEIKTANQSRVKPSFCGFFFAVTENEIEAAEQLKERHRVALYNKSTGELLLTSIPEIISRQNPPIGRFLYSSSVPMNGLDIG